MQTNKDSRSLVAVEKLPITIQVSNLKKSRIECVYGKETLDISQRNNTKTSHPSNCQLNNERSLIELNLLELHFIHSAIMREGVQ